MKITRSLIANTLVIVGLVILGYFLVRRAEGFEDKTKEYYLKSTPIHIIPGSDLADKGMIKDIQYEVYKNGAYVPMTTAAKIDNGGTSLTYTLMSGGKKALRKPTATGPVLGTQSKLPLPGNHASLAGGIRISNLTTSNLGVLSPQGDPNNNGAQFKVKLVFE
jgi:hypothetical protein